MDPQRDFVWLVNTEMRYYLGIQDPDALSDDEWAKTLKTLQWIRSKEAEGRR